MLPPETAHLGRAPDANPFAAFANADDCLELLYPEVDNAGYDLEDNGVVRHIQLKASYVGGKTASQKVHTRLSEKPSGCVIWIYFNEDTLELGPFLFFDSLPGEKLPSLDGLKVAKHIKGDQGGWI